MLFRSEVTTAAENFGFGVLPYFPLASGLLTGKIRPGQSAPADSRLSVQGFDRVVTPENIDKVERLRAWAEQRGWSVTRLALSWLASQPVVGSVIAGATSPQQVRENAEATDSHMTPEEVSEAASLVS